jgi:hypothetical protein
MSPGGGIFLLGISPPAAADAAPVAYTPRLSEARHPRHGSGGVHVHQTRLDALHRVQPRQRNTPERSDSSARIDGKVSLVCPSKEIKRCRRTVTLFAHLAVLQRKVLMESQGCQKERVLVEVVGDYDCNTLLPRVVVARGEGKRHVRGEAQRPRAHDAQSDHRRRGA